MDIEGRRPPWDIDAARFTMANWVDHEIWSRRNIPKQSNSAENCGMEGKMTKA